MKIRPLIGIASASAVLASSLVCSIPAGAARASETQYPRLSDVELTAALDELRGAGLVIEDRVAPDGLHSTVALGDGMTVDIVSTKSESRLGGGYDSGGHYVLFNQFDQAMLYNGSGFLLGAAICAIPAVGQIACLAVQAIIAVAAAAVSAQKGTCKNNKQLKVYFSNNHAAKSGCV